MGSQPGNQVQETNWFSPAVLTIAITSPWLIPENLFPPPPPAGLPLATGVELLVPPRPFSPRVSKGLQELPLPQRGRGAGAGGGR